MSDWPEAVISSISERSRTSSLPSWRRSVTAVADSLAISPFRTRPSTVATVKLAYFASNARLGSRMAIRSDSGDLSFKAGEVGADLDAFVAEPMARGAQLLEHGRAGGLVALDRRAPSDRRRRPPGGAWLWWAKTASARARSADRAR